MAEESSQPAFQSLESIVHAFGSISMMLDSTLTAVYSSFRAVLGMADQFSRMRTHLSKVFSALAIFRTAKWALHKLFYIFGMSDYAKT
jgi:peroxin-13